jgi:hypothetical protein
LAEREISLETIENNEALNEKKLFGGEMKIV